MTPLHVVARRGRITTVDCLIDKGADINIKDNNEVNIYTRLCYYSKSVLSINLFPLTLLGMVQYHPSLHFIVLLPSTRPV